MKSNKQTSKYFKFDELDTQKNKPWHVLLINYIISNKWDFIVLLIIVVLIMVFQPMLMLIVLAIIATAAVRYNFFLELFAEENAKIKLLERKRQRKHFAKINNLIYKNAVSYESTIQISDTDNIAENYLEGELGGISFWTADTRYDYEINEGEIFYNKTTATTIFLDTEVPNFQIINREGLNKLNMANFDILVSNNFKLSEQFDKKYIFRIPENYGIDAYYIFTPELLEIIYKYKPWLVELQGQSAIIHTRGAIETKEDYMQLARLIHEVGGELIENTHRYQDWRSDIKKQVHEVGKKIPQ